MALTDVNLFRIDGTVGSIPSADIDVIKNAASISNNIVLNSDGTTTLTPSNIIKSSTAQASTSGTAIDFTGIPSWVKRITVMFDGISSSGGSLILVRLGAGSVTSSGYSTSWAQDGGAANLESSGFCIGQNNGSDVTRGALFLNLLSSNTWIGTGMVVRTNAISQRYFGGSVTLSGTLDRVRITTVNGTDTFDAGTINILYEG